jgi:bifunctional DNA-binding transcriptional regulator/antitoxin component of YhaV-PrlF toxin-antitoxin module
MGTAAAKEQATLTVTAEGQVTLKRDVLQHLGVKPGEKIVVDKLLDGQIKVRAAQQSRDISEIFGYFKTENGPHLTIEEMNDVISHAWAGER